MLAAPDRARLGRELELDVDDEVARAPGLLGSEHRQEAGGRCGDDRAVSGEELLGLAPHGAELQGQVAVALTLGQHARAQDLAVALDARPAGRGRAAAP